MVRQVFTRLAPMNIAVIGDLILDTYTIGKASRISPEAPVPVLNVEREERRAGGAGNVLLNLLSLNAKVVPIMRIGCDSGGEHLHALFCTENIPTDGVFKQPGYITPTKNRIIANNQQIVRIDHEEIAPLPELFEQKVIEALPILLKDVDAIAVSDYGKGFVSRTLFAAVVEYAAERKVPIIVDPKDPDFSRYRGAFIIKPNQTELYAAARMRPNASLDDAAAVVLKASEADILMVTRSEAGIALFHKEGERQDFPVTVQQVRDVTGAGDTVLAMLTLAIANKLSIGEATQLANIAAGIAISRFGCARVTLTDIAERLLVGDVGSKIFDGEHLLALQHALQGKKIVMLEIDHITALTMPLFSAINELAAQGDALLISLKDEDLAQGLLDMLAALPQVDFILPNTLPAAFQESLAIEASYRFSEDALLSQPC